VDDVENFMTSELTMSATPVAMFAGRARPLAPVSLGAEIRMHGEPVGCAAAVRIAPATGLPQEKSALLTAERVQTVLRHTQLNAYGFGTPVGVDVPSIDVATGVPPRSRPV
jgi:hypothetical protein